MTIIGMYCSLNQVPDSGFFKICIFMHCKILHLPDDLRMPNLLKSLPIVSFNIFLSSKNIWDSVHLIIGEPHRA
jgi:hypothetical protein